MHRNNITDRSMINVLHISDKLSVGDATLHGVTRLFSWWIPRFDKSRFHVMVGSLRKKDKAAEYLESLGIRVFCLGRGKFDPRTLFDFIRLIKIQEIHIVHLHGYGATTFGRIASYLTGVIAIVHEHIYDEQIPAYQRWVDMILSWKTSNAIAISNSVKEFLVRYRSITPDHITVIVNGIPIRKSTEGSQLQKKNWKSKLNIPQSHKVVVTVGRLNPIKGISYFLEAAQQVLSKFKSVTFLVVGDGELLTSLEQQCKEMGISENVVFMGYCRDVPTLLSEMDIKVIASLFEGGPITLFEAMAAGCAIVSTDTIGLKDVVEIGPVGFLVPPRNSKMIAEKVLLLLNDEALRKEMGRRAEVLSRKYDISRTVKQFEDYYEKIIIS